MISENKLPFVRERVGASPCHVVLLEHEHLLPDLGEQGGHGEAADAAADHDGVQVGGDLVLEKPKENCIKNGSLVRLIFTSGLVCTHKFVYKGRHQHLSRCVPEKFPKYI